MSLKNLQLYIKLLFLFYYIGFCQQTSMNFLKIPTTARYAALGGYCAISDDVGGVFLNPAGLVRCRSTQIGVTHNEHFQNSKYEFVAAVFPKRNFTLSFGLALFYIDNIEARGYKDLDLEYTSPYQIIPPEYYYNTYALQTGVGFSKKLLNKFLFGTTFKFLQESISNVSGCSVATDFGFQVFVNKANNLNIAFSINNLGFPVKYEKEKYPLPTQLIFGGEVLFKNLNLVCDVVFPVFDREDLYINVGSEVFMLDHFYLRAGYKYRPFNCQLSNFTFGLSGGVGFDFFGTKFDYSVISYEVLGLSHKFSLILELDKFGRFYEFFRKKIFKPHSSVLEKSSPVVDVKKILNNSKTSRQENLLSSTEVFKEEIVSVNINLLSVDSQNRVLVYEVILSSKTKLDESIFLDNLNAKVITREQLPKQVSFKVYISTPVFEILVFEKPFYCRIFDFSEMSGLGVFDCNIEFSSYVDRVDFYLLDKDNKMTKITNVTTKKKNSIYYYSFKYTLLDKLIVVYK